MAVYVSRKRAEITCVVPANQAGHIATFLLILNANFRRRTIKVDGVVSKISLVSTQPKAVQIYLLV